MDDKRIRWYWTRDDNKMNNKHIFRSLIYVVHMAMCEYVNNRWHANIAATNTYRPPCTVNHLCLGIVHAVAALFPLSLLSSVFFYPFFHSNKLQNNGDRKRCPVCWHSWRFHLAQSTVAKSIFHEITMAFHFGKCSFVVRADRTLSTSLASSLALSHHRHIILTPYILCLMNHIKRQQRTNEQIV